MESYEVKLAEQEVFVTGNIPYDDLLEKIKKTGKEVSLVVSALGTVAECSFDVDVQVRSGETLE